MKAFEWIDRVKTARHWDSDYRVAKELGMRPSTISQYRSHGGTLDEGVALKVASALGERPEAIVLDQAAERVKAPEIRSALLDVARRLCILCSIVAPVPKPRRHAAPQPKRHPLDGVWHAMA